MKRKGWDPKAEDAQSIVAVHNTINEKAWSLVMEYEKLHQRCDLITTFLISLANVQIQNFYDSVVVLAT
jgi:hypothetical protein